MQPSNMTLEELQRFTLNGHQAASNELSRRLLSGEFLPLDEVEAREEEISAEDYSEGYSEGHNEGQSDVLNFLRHEACQCDEFGDCARCTTLAYFNFL